MTKKPEIKTFVNEEDRLRCSLPMYKTQNPFTGIMKEFHKNSQCLWEWLNYNGQLFSKGNYKNGQQEGLHESFYDNGQLRRRQNFKNGKRHGFWENSYVVSNSNPFVLRDQLEEKGNYKNGQRHGLWESFYQNGQLLSKGNYKNGQSEGLWEWFHVNGQLKSRNNYKNGKKTVSRNIFMKRANVRQE